MEAKVCFVIETKKGIIVNVPCNFCHHWREKEFSYFKAYYRLRYNGRVLAIVKLKEN